MSFSSPIVAAAQTGGQQYGIGGYGGHNGFYNLCFSDFMSQVISLLHRRIAFDLPGMPYPQAVHYTFDRCSVETIEKSLERIDRSLYFLLVVFGRRNDKVKFLVRGRSNDRLTSSSVRSSYKSIRVSPSRSRRRLAFYREFRTCRLFADRVCHTGCKRCNPYNNEWPCRREKSFPPGTPPPGLRAGIRCKAYLSCRRGGEMRRG